MPGKYKFLIAAAFASSWTATPSWSQSRAETANRVRTYSIAPGSMRAALDAWARQSGTPVLYRSEEVDALRSRGVRGKLDAVAALRAVVGGSGLILHRDRSGAIAVTQSSASGGGTDALSACSSWTPERSKVEAATMAAERGGAPQHAKKFAQQTKPRN